MKLRFRSIAYPLMILLGLALGMLYCLSVYLRLARWDELEYFDLRKHLFIPLVNYTT